MRFKSKYYIVFPRKMVEEIEWPQGWGHQCAGNVAEMLREHLGVSRIASEIKFLVSESERWKIINDYNVSYQDTEDFLNSQCSTLHFNSKIAMKKAATALKKMGAKKLTCTDSYREVILQHGYYKHNNEFKL